MKGCVVGIRRAGFVGLGVLLAMFAGVVPGAVGQPGDSGAVVEGAVVDATTGSPIAGIDVTAQRFNEQGDGVFEVVASTGTAADGTYRFEGLPPDTYRFEFTDPMPGEHPYTGQAYDMAPDVHAGTDVVVGAGAVVSGIDAALTRSSVVVGRVVDAATGAGIEGIAVRGHAVEPRSPREDVWHAVTEADGTFRLARLTAGSYRLHADPASGSEYADSWWDGRVERRAADILTLAPGTTTRDIDVGLVPGAMMSGRVVDAVTGEPIRDAQIDLVDVDGRRMGVPSGEGRGTGDDGRWEATTVHAGTYRVVVRYWFVGEGQTGWFAEDAPVVTVAEGERRDGVEVGLRPGGAVVGVVRDVDGEPITLGCVTAVDQDGTATSTDLHGPQPERYALTGLRPGTYRVAFSEACGGHSSAGRPGPGRAPAWFGGATFEEADPVVVEAGAFTEADLTAGESGGAVQVLVRDAETGAVLGFDDVCVSALNPRSPVPSTSDSRLADGSFVVGALEPGAVEVTVTGCDPFGFHAYEPATVQVEVTRGEQAVIEVLMVDRVSRVEGPSRIETAVAVSRQTLDAAGTVVIARADVYADALVGGPLAAAVNAPILLSYRDTLHPATRDEIQRLGATTAYVLGSTVALNDVVVEGLRAAGITEVVRFAGTDRFDTARQVADHLGGPTALVVEGAHADATRGWPDAVSASGLASTIAAPILLVEHDRLPDATRLALQGRTTATIVGGTAAVSTEVEEQTAASGIAVDRIAGPDRYATSTAVATRATDAGADPGRLWMATGHDWPDALAAGPASSRYGGVLLLTDGAPGSNASTVQQWTVEHQAVLTSTTLVGGADVLSPLGAAHALRAFDRRCLLHADC